jgi:hypothetical protein
MESESFERYLVGIANTESHDQRFRNEDQWRISGIPSVEWRASQPSPPPFMESRPKLFFPRLYNGSSPRSAGHFQIPRVSLSQI